MIRIVEEFSKFSANIIRILINSLIYHMFKSKLNPYFIKRANTKEETQFKVLKQLLSH